ncbi:DUF1361 domain-containing protein [Patescibacteria group bacterium]|nr:MAG: DUF1361 domain-containing protein [Patescibacteria group bacterium]
MKTPFTHRAAFAIGVCMVTAVFLLHDWNLYPNLRPFGVPVLSVLRLVLLGVPLFSGWSIARGSASGLKSAFAWLLWLTFLPYTLYSVTEIRHVAELCRLPSGETYTGVCVDRLWTLYPVFLYALTGFLSYVFSLAQVATARFRDSGKKRLFMVSMCLLASFASVFGLYTRLNVWDALLRPQQMALSALQLFTARAFLVNLAWFFAFTVVTTFIVHRMMYRSSRYIFRG